MPWIVDGISWPVFRRRSFWANAKSLFLALKPVAWHAFFILSLVPVNYSWLTWGPGHGFKQNCLEVHRMGAWGFARVPAFLRSCFFFPHFISMCFVCVCFCRIGDNYFRRLLLYLSLPTLQELLLSSASDSASPQWGSQADQPHLAVRFWQLMQFSQWLWCSLWRLSFLVRTVQSWWCSIPRNSTLHEVHYALQEQLIQSLQWSSMGVKMFKIWNS